MKIDSTHNFVYSKAISLHLTYQNWQNRKENCAKNINLKKFPVNFDLK